MRAARLNTTQHSLTLEEVPLPEARPGEVVVKVEAAGVCLSDVHLIDGSLKPLLLQGDTVTLGHEVAGTVHELGAGVTGWREGQRVVLQAGENRGGVVHTLGVDYDGGWAEYVATPAATLVALPDDLPFEQAAIIPDAVSTPWAAITQTGQVRPAEPVGVWGVGGLGAHGVQLLRTVGAFPIIAVDPSPAARERALAFGADLALDSGDPDFRTKVTAATNGLGVAAAFDFAGFPAVREQAVKVLAPGGRLVLTGLTNKPLVVEDGTRFSYLKQQILGHYGSEPQHVPELVALTAGHRLDFSRSITDVYPLDEAQAAVDRMITKEGNPLRLILKP
ncbi:zinc-binding dehydrogenase [Streptomyces sp. NPDC090306]|uniref:zinc-binding dehydrogenase n=1 Tax=Streptomyces sp. NPDC090306 TaxID=3365961 RepID=UPI0038135659